MIRNACADHLDFGQLQPLLINVHRLGVDAARTGAPDVHPVRFVGEPGHDLALNEQGHNEHHVVQVAHAAKVRHVGDEDVARLDIPGPIELALDGLDARLQHADESGNARAGAGKVAVGVEQRHPKIKHFVDDRTHRRLAHGGEHFIGDRRQGTLDDFSGDRIAVLRPVPIGGGISHVKPP